MKQTLSLLLSMFAFILYAQHTDLKEYGYRGKVKEVRTKTFVQVDPKTGKTTENVNFFTTVIFSVNGDDNFHEVKTISATDSLRVTRNVYSFKDSKKASMKTFDKKGNELKADTAIFKWINEKTYILVYQYNNYFYEITTILNDDYRDYMGITCVYEWVDREKKFRKAELSENIFGKDGHIEKIIVTDIETQVKTTRFVKDKVLDTNGNLIQYTVYDDSNELLQYVERQFEYGS